MALHVFIFRTIKMFVLGCVLFALSSIHLLDYSPKQDDYHEVVVGVCGINLFYMIEVIILDWSYGTIFIWLDIGIFLLHIPFLILLITHIWPIWVSHYSNEKRGIRHSSVWFRFL